MVEVGGGFRSVVLAGREVLDGYGADDMAGSGRGEVLMPWPNRLRDGSYTFEGRDYQVRSTSPSSATRSTGSSGGWPGSLVERAPDRVTMEHVLRASPGYPFTLRLRISYLVDDAGLTAHTTVTNVGSSSAPFGAGAHPWLRAATGTVDAAVLHVPATIGIWSDERSLPARTGAVDGTELDFRTSRPIGATRIDNGFTQLERDDAGIARVTLTGPSGDGVAVWLDRSYPYVMLSTGDVLPDVARRVHRDRADDLPTKCVPDRRGAHPARAGRHVHGQLGNQHHVEEHHMSLENKAAIVTGGDSGIGHGISLELARQGAAVTINFHKNADAADATVKEIQAAGGKAQAVQGDVSSVADIQNLVDKTVAAFGRLDIMVNNAGMETRTSTLETTERQFDLVIAIDLKSAFFGVQLAAKQMIAQGGGGRIINISSIHEDWPMPGNSPYCAAKGGVRMLTRTAGVELAPHGITVVGVAPGAVHTPIDEVTLADPVARAKLESAIPLGRVAEPTEIANLVAFLASDGASYGTATTYVVDGGMMQASVGL